MAFIGGYQIVDLQNKSLSSTKTVIKGVYEAIEGTRKPILLSNINAGGTELHDCFVLPYVSSGDFKIALADGDGSVITITDDDEVTLV